MRSGGSRLRHSIEVLALSGSVIKMIAAYAYEMIAQLTDNDSEWALKFCREVRQSCLVAPSLSSIAEAVEQQGVDGLSISSIADLASRIQQLGAGNVLPLTQPSLPAHRMLPVVDLIRDDAAIQGMSRHLNAIVARSVLSSIINLSIEGRTISFDGDGPYFRADLEQLAAKLGGFVDDGGLPWDAIDWMVIGRQGYGEDELATSVEYGELEYFSQETFLGVILFGRTCSPAAVQDPRWEHILGMEFVGVCLDRRHTGPKLETAPEDEPGPGPLTSPGASAHQLSDIQEDEVPPETIDQFKWPDFQEGSSDVPLQSTDEWQLESDLRRLGYSVARGVSLDQRRSCLHVADDHLGLAKVVRHLAWLIRFHGEDARQKNALSNWEMDLGWLKARYGAPEADK